MTHFRDYTPEKYSSPDFEKVEEGIYQTKDPYGIVKDKMIYVTSLSFQLEPDQLGEEEGTPQDIPQMICEALLDEYMLFATDFYEEVNRASEVTCYQEFGAMDIEDIRELRQLIGKRFYAVPLGEEEEDYEIVIEEE